ncbi:hypothetical protein K461DRAFT_265232 [Myriangium duriaei CBS 260.36]|uniref:Uncharacterized protein n=1 Tax=Myriangium duriaei CBS 260.36 TaxID=1168546 RepID=A0A9P4MI90_9PEZI|nr:hypothetical protein K461DRAFT_265232 [Myriangium duriaei CBS 260.36]
MAMLAERCVMQTFPDYMVEPLSGPPSPHDSLISDPAVDDFSIPSVECFLKDPNIQTALDIARNCETEVDFRVWEFLESNISQIWSKLQCQPDSYILKKDEFAVFNFFVYRFQGSNITEKAIARFWQNYTSPRID